MFFPTEQDLRDAAQDVAHEISVFWDAYDCLFLPPPRIRGRVPYQAWYVLARNLMDFFDTLPCKRVVCPKSGQKLVCAECQRKAKDAVLAGDYFDPPLTWHAKRHEVSPPTDYPGYKVAAHKRAAHLSYARANLRRGSAKNPCDPTREASEYLMRLARLFLNLLPPERQQWFRDAAGRESFRLPW